MASKNLMDLMNESIARELQVSIQYMWQHVQWLGVQHYAVQGEFKSIGIVEMKHAEKIAERLFYLGSKPTVEPNPITVGANLKQMIEQDIKDETGAIELYRKVIDTANAEGDITTRRLFEDILADEEGHLDTFTSLLEAMK